MQIVGISGYSRSGKTSLLSYLTSRHDYLTLSTTQYLNTATLDFFNLPRTPENYDALVSKQGEACQKIQNRLGMSVRDMKITVAESHLAPTYGRFRGIVLPTVDTFAEQCKAGGLDLNDHRVIVEVYNHKELVMMLIALELTFGAGISTGFNIRRKSEMVGVDKRELVFDDDFWNVSSIGLMGEFIHGSFDNHFREH